MFTRTNEFLPTWKDERDQRFRDRWGFDRTENERSK